MLSEPRLSREGSMKWDTSYEFVSCSLSEPRGAPDATLDEAFSLCSLFSLLYLPFF